MEKTRKTLITLLIKLYWVKVRYHLGIVPDEGICVLTKTRSLGRYFKTWDKYSGKLVYPVPSPGLTAQSAFWKLYKWEGSYGLLRYDLLCHIIKSVKNDLKGN
jgi:hypothetical protein